MWLWPYSRQCLSSVFKARTSRLVADAGRVASSFMQWPGAILTDSGGFQMVSLADLCRVTEDGVGFKSHLDGSWHQLTPELCMEIQAALGSDFMMMLDHCPLHIHATEAQAREAVERTTRWAKRCLAVSRQSHINTYLASFRVGSFHVYDEKPPLN